MKRLLYATFWSIVCLAPGFALPGWAAPPLPIGRPPFVAELFPPEQVMRYQTEIGLTATQQAAISQAMSETHAKLVELQWKLEAATQALTKILEKETVDETTALAQWQDLVGIEQQVKKNHLTLLIRIKNQLTPSQQEKLRSLRPAGPGPMGGPPWLRGQAGGMGGP